MTVTVVTGSWLEKFSDSLQVYLFENINRSYFKTSTYSASFFLKQFLLSILSSTALLTSSPLSDGPFIASQWKLRKVEAHIPLLLGAHPQQDPLSLPPLDHSASAQFGSAWCLLLLGHICKSSSPDSRKCRIYVAHKLTVPLLSSLATCLSPPVLPKAGSPISLADCSDLPTTLNVSISLV